VPSTIGYDSGRMTPSIFQGAPTLSVALPDNRPCATSPVWLLQPFSDQ
jgi:hypothetical protein